MTSSKKREVTKIWAILQMLTNNILGVGVSFFRYMQTFLPYFDMLANKLLL